MPYIYIIYIYIYILILFTYLFFSVSLNEGRIPNFVKKGLLWG